MTKQQPQVGDSYRVTNKWDMRYDAVGEIVAIDHGHKVFYCPVWLEFSDGSREWYEWDHIKPAQTAQVG